MQHPFVIEGDQWWIAREINIAKTLPHELYAFSVEAQLSIFLETEH